MSTARPSQNEEREHWAPVNWLFAVSFEPFLQGLGLGQVLPGAPGCLWPGETWSAHPWRAGGTTSQVVRGGMRWWGGDYKGGEGGWLWSHLTAASFPTVHAQKKTLLAEHTSPDNHRSTASLQPRPFLISSLSKWIDQEDYLEWFDGKRFFRQSGESPMMGRRWLWWRLDGRWQDNKRLLSKQNWGINLTLRRCQCAVKPEWALLIAWNTLRLSEKRVCEVNSLTFWKENDPELFSFFQGSLASCAGWTSCFVLQRLIDDTVWDTSSK